MKRVDRTFPLPSFIMNKNFSVQSFSSEAESVFGTVENLLDLFDEESVPKIKKWVTPELHKLSLETHLKPVGAQINPVTCDLHIKWENDLYAEVLIITKDEQINQVTKTLDQLRSRLNATNFELLEEKEKLEDAISHGNRLSAPFIRLTSDTALVPLYGDITAEKMHTIEEPLLYAFLEGDVEQILFDFTAVGQLDQEGTQLLKNLMTSFFYMGAQVTIIGVRPEQVKSLQANQFPKEIRYMNSLQQAVKKYCSK